ncbi:MAG: glucosaminidase domain-containing protein [Patescibacteria group bacterium]|nr:glucosaminidase domain-containing protein [Patescibacteria group bacterium]MDE2588315.1 glucosaminidase domain-containing protein [Patescibacteria group bacterium]
MKAGIIVLFALFFSLIAISHAYADEKASGSSATFAELAAAQQEDDRTVVLKRYLEEQHSPLAPLADVFVAQADLYQLPWDLVAAMTGTESTFGQAVPVGCNNPLGFGIYGNQMLCFPSYREAIKTVSKSLRENYLDKWGATDVCSIAKLYAASPMWCQHTTYFMNDIEAYKLQYESQALPISL